MLDGRVENLPSSKSSTSTGCDPMNSSNQTTENINSICEGLGCNESVRTRNKNKVQARRQEVQERPNKPFKDALKEKFGVEF
jgi:hypothetical protein